MSVSVFAPGAAAPWDACLAIARALPGYFTPAAVAQIQHDLAHHGTYVVAERPAGAVAGFAVVQRKNAAVAELLWLAVHPAHQGRGLGTELLAALMERLGASGVALLAVKTLAPEAGYAPYVGTRRFYERAGFVHLETVDPYPGWDPDSPCAIYVKILPGHEGAGRHAPGDDFPGASAATGS
jgi:GNAT superfamily N-acetyltransferase